MNQRRAHMNPPGTRTIWTMFGPLIVPTPRSVDEMERQHQLMVKCSHFVSPPNLGHRFGKDYCQPTCFRSRIKGILAPVVRQRRLIKLSHDLSHKPPVYGRWHGIRRWVAVLGYWQDWKCADCKINVRRWNHVDHIVPLSKGGTNLRQNLQLLCPACNLAKGAKVAV